jgi:hypothetical protein
MFILSHKLDAVMLLSKQHLILEGSEISFLQWNVAMLLTGIGEILNG